MSTPDRSVADLRVAPGVPRGGGRDALTGAAREIFAERGYHGASIRDIARRAGLSLSALYYWHPSKQSLLAALIEESAQAFFRMCEIALAEAGDDPTERLRAMVAATVEFRVRHRVESNIGAREWRNLEPANRERLDGLRRSATLLWAGIVDEGVARGVFCCEHPDDARRAIEAACNAIAQWYDPRGELGLPDLVARYTAIALRIVDHRP
ncbi:TetR/AcrR family transcriptional regulator [Pseudonocardia asaccharolytica]|uniref:TetR family transcriptional regulator n=1 Tax=Pseudonocardia asaccharolytica DSM 44247 = NBRC 16224 TaxID=1123024 RepID=A0A511D6S1_9PSEU|nr:TetR/AcrR family transcriptional regulator [Pseudonocardia asaccharolytica]GEL20485.1 TetR family transcriptional regulator [Pseudonocardia asaccharolytica DSM 44247 = NBRC 16224]